MRIRYGNHELERLDSERGYGGRYPPEVVKAFRKVLGWIEAAEDERDFYTLRGLHFERLRFRTGQYSMRLNKQFRLILEFEGENPKTVIVVAIEDYH